jgi:SAM-dependent methyltransferase
MSAPGAASEPAAAEASGAASEPAEEEEEIDYDALSFTDPRYWAHFYDEDAELDFYECARRRTRSRSRMHAMLRASTLAHAARPARRWYSAEDWLPVAVEAVAARVRRDAGLDALDALDVGVGTSPLLFALAAAAPSAWRALHGVDFAETAVAFLAEQAARPGAHAGLRFWAADARELAGVPDASVDILLDKGCLDCFVTGDGEADVARYLAAVARVLRPHGRALLLAVNGADVPRLLARGEIVADPHAGSGMGAAAGRCAWGAAKQVGADAAGAAWVQRLWVEETVAYAEKHVLVCRPTPPPEGAPPPPLRCHECGRRHVSAAFAPPGDAPPKPTCACGNRLRRFALS